MCDSVAFCTVFTSANAPSFLLIHSFSFVIIFLSCLKLISLATNQCTALHCTASSCIQPRHLEENYHFSPNALELPTSNERDVNVDCSLYCRHESRSRAVRNVCQRVLGTIKRRRRRRRRTRLRFQQWRWFQVSFQSYWERTCVFPLTFFSSSSSSSLLVIASFACLFPLIVQ